MFVVKVTTHGEKANCVNYPTWSGRVLLAALMFGVKPPDPEQIPRVCLLTGGPACYQKAYY